MCVESPRSMPQRFVALGTHQFPPRNSEPATSRELDLAVRDVGDVVEQVDRNIEDGFVNRPG
jgi:hypothetical protein